MAEPITGINRFNFVELGKAFMKMNGGHGFIIVRDEKVRARNPDINVYDIDIIPGDDEGNREKRKKLYYPATPREWAAWRAWRKSKNLGWTLMEKRGWYTVPARWPHLFDADWPEHKSVDAANRFQDKIEREAQRAPKRRRYLDDPNVSIEDCPRLAAAYPSARAILAKATAAELRKWVEAHAHGRPIAELGGLPGDDHLPEQFQ